MKQMVAPQSPSIGRAAIGTVEFGFMRDKRGKIFFLSSWGEETLCQAVLEDKTIVPEQDDFPWPGQEVDLINPKDLGITEIKYAPVGTKPTLA